MKGLGRPAYILCISLLWGIFLYIEKWFDKKEIVDDGAGVLPYDSIIEGRCFYSAITYCIFNLGGFYDRE